MRFDTLNIALSYGIRSIASGNFIIDIFGHGNTTSYRMVEEAFIEEIFFPKEASAIQAIPPSAINQHDKQV